MNRHMETVREETARINGAERNGRILVFPHDLILEKNTIFSNGIHVNGNVFSRNGVKHSLTVNGNMYVHGDIAAWDLLVEGNLVARNIYGRYLTVQGDISYSAVCWAYEHIKCDSIKGRYRSARHFSLNGKVEEGILKNSRRS